jgi:aryl-alcohol dehydrogenase-like predicted oxidoreductase
VRAALDAGVAFFDTADVYGGTKSEQFLGRALADAGVRADRRDDVWIATKFGVRVSDDMPGGAAPDYVRKACDASLARLGVDRIDLYQQHVPDPSVPIAETLGALAELVIEGKVRFVGCSNYRAAQLDEAAAVAVAGSTTSFVTVQNEWSLLNRAPESSGVVDAAVRHGLAVLPYFPLASGLLTGKYRPDEALPDGTRLAKMPDERRASLTTDRNWAVVESLRSFAESHGHSLLELALSWLASQPAIGPVIAGATSADQVRSNAAAATAWRLTDDELAEVDRLAAPSAA